MKIFQSLKDTIQPQSYNQQLKKNNICQKLKD